MGYFLAVSTLCTLCLGSNQSVLVWDWSHDNLHLSDGERFYVGQTKYRNGAKSCKRHLAGPSSFACFSFFTNNEFPLESETCSLYCVPNSVKHVDPSHLGAKIEEVFCQLPPHYLDTSQIDGLYQLTPRKMCRWRLPKMGVASNGLFISWKIPISNG